MVWFSWFVRLHQAWCGNCWLVYGTDQAWYGNRGLMCGVVHVRFMVYGTDQAWCGN